VTLVDIRRGWISARDTSPKFNVSMLPNTLNNSRSNAVRSVT